MPSPYGDPKMAALGGFISNVEKLFADAQDPRNQAAAAKHRADMELYPLKRQEMQAGIDLNKARALTEGSQRGYYDAQTGDVTARTGFRNQLGGAAAQFGAPPADLESLVAGFEGFNPNPYSDGAQTSIGFGTKAPAGLASAPLTREQGIAALRSELGNHGSRIDTAANQFGVQLSPEQRNALVSFDYNTGKGVDMLQRFGGDFQTMANTMRQYTKGREGGNPNGAKVDMEGLRTRRQKETELLLGRVTQDPRALAVLAEAAATSPSATSLMSGLAQGEALNGVPSEQRARELFLAQGKMPSLTDAFMPQTQLGLIQQKAQNDNIGNVYSEAAKAAFGGGTSGASGSRLDPADIYKISTNASSLADRTFGIQRDEAGMITAGGEDPVAITQRDSLAKLSAHYMSQGADPLSARDQAAVDLFGSANYSDPAFFQQPSGGFLGMGSAGFLATRFNPDALLKVQQAPQQGNAAALGVLQQLFGGGQPQAPAAIPAPAPAPQTGLPPDAKARAVAELARRKQAAAMPQQAERLNALQSQAAQNQGLVPSIGSAFMRDLGTPAIDTVSSGYEDMSNAFQKSGTDAVNYLSGNSPIGSILSKLFGSGMTEQQQMEADYLRRKLQKQNSGQ